MTGEKALIVDQFIRKLTREGKREKAENLIKKALEIIARSRALALPSALKGSSSLHSNASLVKGLRAAQASKSSETELSAKLGKSDVIISNEQGVSKNLLSRWSRITAVGYNLVPVAAQTGAVVLDRRQSVSALARLNVWHDNIQLWDPLLTAIEIAKPQTTVVATRIAGTAYRVPVALKEKSSRSYAIRWIVMNAKKRSETSMAIRLANEIEEINGRSSSASQNATLKQRDDLHKIAEANRAFINYMK